MKRQREKTVKRSKEQKVTFKRPVHLKVKIRMSLSDDTVCTTRKLFICTARNDLYRIKGHKLYLAKN